MKKPVKYIGTLFVTIQIEKKLKCLQLVDHNVAVNRNGDCKANNVTNQDDSDDSFEDFLEDFQVGVQDDKTSNGTC